MLFTLQDHCIMGSAWHSHPTAIFISSGFLGNPRKTGSVYGLGLGSAQFGNLKH